LFLAGLTLTAVLSTIRNNAFLAEENGIWLGLRGGARRRLFRRRREHTYLPWAEIQQLRIARRHYGARLDILVLAEPTPGRFHLVWRFIAAVLTLIMPAAYLFRRPGLLRPRSHGARYRIPLYEVTAEKLSLALQPLAPPTLSIAVVPRWHTRALRRGRRSRLTTAA
jgi:hypothetical protein